MNQNIKTAGIVLAAAVFFIIDRALKALFTGIWRRADFRLIGEWLSFKLSFNSGIAFSLPIDSILIISAICAIILILSHFAWRELAQNRSAAFFALMLMIFGAYSNLLDRLKFGAVADYIDLKYFTVFNLADAMIAIGAVVFLLSKIKKKPIISG